MKKYRVVFRTNSSPMPLTETVEGSSWQYVKAMLESKYQGLQVLQYTPV